MKTLLISLFVVLLSFQSIAQISPDEFPKIGYADMYWLKKAPLYYGYNSSNPIDYSDSAYFYPQLLELGLTHVTSFGEDIPLNSGYNTSIKILDNNFDKYKNHPPYNDPSKYCVSIGNAIEHLAYEAGGDIALLDKIDHNYGFGTPGSLTEDAYSSWWIFPFNDECDPEIDLTKSDQGRTVHYLQAGQGPGKILVARLNSQHSGRLRERNWNNVLKLFIEARIDGLNNSDPVAEVRVYEIPSSSSDNIEYHRGLRGEYYDENPEQLTDFTYTIYANDFDGNGYTSIESPQFVKQHGGTNNNSNIGVEITMLDTRNLYVDRIAVCNLFYEELFLSDAATQQQVREEIRDDLLALFSSISGNPLFCHLYRDEPVPMFYRAIGEVSNIAETHIGVGKYINSATMGLLNDMMGWANLERRLPYVLYNKYPF